MGARKWIFGGLVIVAVAIVAITVNALRAKEVQEQSKLEAALARAESLGLPVYAEHLRTNPVPDEENAWVELKAIKGLMDEEQDRPWRSLRDLYLEKDPDLFLAEAKAPLASGEEIFRFAYAAAKKPLYAPEREWESGVAMLFGDLGSDKTLTIWLLAKSRYSFYDGDSETAIASLETAASIAAHLRAERSSVGTFVRIALESLIAREIVGQAYASDSADHMAALGSILDGLYVEQDVSSLFIEEVVMFVEWVRMISDENEFGNKLRDEVGEDSLSPLGEISGMSVPHRKAREFEIRAILAACDYFESLSTDVNDHKANDSALADLVNLSSAWAGEGFPFGFIEIYGVLEGIIDPLDLGTYGQHFRSLLAKHMYRKAFEIVTGATTLQDGEKWNSDRFRDAEFEYLEYEGGFSITATAPGLDPYTLKFDRP